MDLKTFQQNIKKDCIISNGHVYVDPDTLQPEQTQCPKCGKVYTKTHTDSCAGTATEREQHISGICSDECWTKGLTK
jgi:hypothetical protein